MDDGIAIRRADQSDNQAIVQMLGVAMGWAGDSRDVDFFSWKHHESPFGTSPAWIALDGDRIVGLRTFMRWQFNHRGALIPAARAVDTATLPEYRRRGIFSSLTRLAIDQLSEEGVSFIFNTPNEKSKPGYLSMGWQAIGRARVQFRPRSPAALVSLRRAQAPAEKWSLPSRAGFAAREILADEGAIDALLDSVRGSEGKRTVRSGRYLAWRYGFPPLEYRALLVGSGVQDGLLLFRLRRRGTSLEAAVCEILVPEDARRPIRSTLRRLLADSGADYAITAGKLPGRLTGLLPLPGKGPEILARPLTASVEELTRPPLDLTLGDIELF